MKVLVCYSITHDTRGTVLGDCVMTTPGNITEDVVRDIRRAVKRELLEEARENRPSDFNPFGNLVITNLIALDDG